MRLDKALTYGMVTRSEAKKLLRSGCVTVNGKSEKDGGKAVSASDDIRVSGEKIVIRLHTHIMMNKPAGVLTATEDKHGETTVLDLIGSDVRTKDLGPIGRLDKDVTGLVILTDDGQLAHHLISPKWDVEKIYEAKAEGKLDEAACAMFETGMDLGDFTALPARLEITGADEEYSLCRVYIHEGKFHQVKRMLENTGHPCLALRRVCIAGVKLDETLPEGAYRYLTHEEEQLLYAAAELDVEHE